MDSPAKQQVSDSPAKQQVSAADFVEQFAVGMVASGMPRMPARVFAFLLSREDGSATAAELGDTLSASPGAISGAVRYLIQLHMVARSHRPGERRDVYQLVSDHWYELIGNREQDLHRWAALSREGVDAVGPETRAGRRLDETARFFEFLTGEMAGVLERWRTEVRNR